VLAGNVTTVHEMRVRPAGKAGADFVGFGGADGGPEDMGCLSLTLQNDSGYWESRQVPPMLNISVDGMIRVVGRSSPIFSIVSC
jgi:hypothetical protein